MGLNINSVFKDVSESMEEACRCLTVVGSNMAGLLQDFDRPPECLARLQPDLARLESETKSLGRNLESVLCTKVLLLPVPKDPVPAASMADKCEEVDELRSQVLALQREKEKLKDQLTVAQGENKRLGSQLHHQSSFCASLGSVLGNLVWKASRVPPVVDLLLSGNKAADFLCIVSGTLESFLETFNTEMPEPAADESQFIMAMGGIVTNMAAAPAGRQFLVSNPNGRELIHQIIRVLPVIPTPSGNCLKRLLLMALYNVSINQAGLNLLHEDGEGAIFSVARACLRPDSTSELRLMALRLLNSLTCEMNDPALLTQIPKQLISELASSNDPQLKSMALEVNENLVKAQEKFNQLSQKSGAGTFAKAPNSELDGVSAENRHANQPTATWRFPSPQ